MIKLIFILFAVALLVYLFGAFIAADFNVKQWSDFGRFIAVLVFIAIGIPIIASNINKL